MEGKGRKAIKPHYEDRFQVLNRRSAIAASSSSSGRRDARLEVPSTRCICKFPPGYLVKDRTVRKRGQRVPRPKVCGGPAKPFVMPPEVRGRESYSNDFFRELIMASPSYKAAVTAGYKVEIRGRVWEAELPSRGNREGLEHLHNNKFKSSSIDAFL